MRPVRQSKSAPVTTNLAFDCVLAKTHQNERDLSAVQSFSNFLYHFQQTALSMTFHLAINDHIFLYVIVTSYLTSCILSPTLKFEPHNIFSLNDMFGQALDSFLCTVPEVQSYWSHCFTAWFLSHARCSFRPHTYRLEWTPSSISSINRGEENSKF